MANLDQAMGLRPSGRILHARVYEAGSTVYKGDPVAFADDGAIDSTVTAPLLGVALNYATAGNDVLVADDPSQEFVVQASAAAINVQTDIGLNYALTLGTPDATYKISRTVLDDTSGDTTATLDVRLLAIEKRPDNAFGSVVDCIVKINNHQLGSHTGTVGL